MKDKNTPANNPNELTTENSVLVLIDHQPWIGLLVHSIDPGLMINNVAGLARQPKTSAFLPSSRRSERRAASSSTPCSRS